MTLYRIATAFLVYVLAVNSVAAGIFVSRGDGVTVTGTDGVTISGTDGVTVTGTDGLLTYGVNGITVTGTDGVTVTGTDGVTVTGTDGGVFTGTDGVTVSGADGVTVSGADGVTISGTDGVTVTGTDGTVYSADSLLVRNANGVTVTGADGVAITGTDGVTVTGTDGVTVSGADGVTISGTDGVSISGADSITGFGVNGVLFEMTDPAGVTVSGVDRVSMTGADGVTVSGADGVTITGTDDGTDVGIGLQSLDPELALRLNEISDDSNVNAVIVFHYLPTAEDLNALRSIGILGGTKYRRLPLIYVTATRSQIVEVSRLPNVRSIYGNRTLSLDSDPYLKQTQIEHVRTDPELTYHNSGLPISGRNVTVAVLDTGVNASHPDLAGRVVQNVRLGDFQSSPVGFVEPVNAEGLVNTDPVSGHGTFVAGLIAGSGAASGGGYDGVAPGAGVLGLSAGDLNLTHVLAGFDYLLERGPDYNVRAVNCSFSANTLYDPHDPVNIASKMLSDAGISVVFSAGNTGAGNATLNPYAQAPWVISVGATDQNGRLAPFSSRGRFNGTSRPSLVAPGVSVVSLRSGPGQTGLLGIATGGDQARLSAGELPYYTTASGTSFSAPQAAGAIALMLESNPELTPAEVKDVLQRSATPLVNYYGHEVGAGMLNTYAAVIEAAFPDRRTGSFRSVLPASGVSFETVVNSGILGTVSPGNPVNATVSVPSDALEANVDIFWGGLITANDLRLQVYGPDGALAAESNRLNLPGLTGRNEKVALSGPAAGSYRVKVSNTILVGTPQEFKGAFTFTRAVFRELSDLGGLSAAEREAVLESIRSFQMIPYGRKFFPGHRVTREELAASIVRSGFVPQYVGSQARYSDVRDSFDRLSVESAQNASGGLFYDATDGGRFKPNNGASKLAAAVAFVKAARLEHLASTAQLAPTITDASTIPAGLRGCAAVALQYGFLVTENGKFNKDRTITRTELAVALVKIKRSLR
ncbi:MAG TPA: S8 family serine peptidase [Aridibacter sp.]|nr:S8 family serine peptidase [Aridibacter sp.]